MHKHCFVFPLIFCDFPLCYKIFGAIDYSINLFGNFARTQEGIILVVQMHKIIFTLVDLPRGTALRYILHIFAHLYFFYVPVFFENHSIASHQFFTDVPGIFSRLTSLKEPFENISPSAGRHLKLFCRGSFRGTLLYS